MHNAGKRLGVLRRLAENTRQNKVLGERKEEGERRMGRPPGLQNSHFRPGVALLVYLEGLLSVCVKI